MTLFESSKRRTHNPSVVGSSPTRPTQGRPGQRPERAGGVVSTLPRGLRKGSGRYVQSIIASLMMLLMRLSMNTTASSRPITYPVG